MLANGGGDGGGPALPLSLRFCLALARASLLIMPRRGRALNMYEQMRWSGEMASHWNVSLSRRCRTPSLRRRAEGIAKKSSPERHAAMLRIPEGIHSFELLEWLGDVSEERLGC